MTRVVWMVALLALAGLAVASDRVAVDVNDDFEQQHARILSALADGKTYSEISSADREAVQASLARISATLRLAGGADGLDEGQKVEVFNDQERVNNILTEASESSRLVCKRVAKTGSHRTTTQCTTVGAQRRAAEEAGDHLRRELRQPPLRPGQ